MEFRKWLEEDYYTLLKVSHTSSTFEINKAFRHKARTCHPDIFPPNSIERKQREQILMARNTLVDPKTRKEYDSTRQIWPDFYLTSMINKFNYKM